MNVDQVSVDQHQLIYELTEEVLLLNEAVLSSNDLVDLFQDPIPFDYYFLFVSDHLLAHISDDPIKVEQNVRH